MTLGVICHRPQGRSYFSSNHTWGFIRTPGGPRKSQTGRKPQLRNGRRLNVQHGGHNKRDVVGEVKIRLERRMDFVGINIVGWNR